MTYVPTNCRTPEGLTLPADCIHSINCLVRIRTPSLYRLLLRVPYVVIPSKFSHMRCVRKGSWFTMSQYQRLRYLISERNLWCSCIDTDLYLHRYVNPIALQKYVQQLDCEWLNDPRLQHRLEILCKP